MDGFLRLDKESGATVYEPFSALWAKAEAAGLAAGSGASPTPMVVGEADGLSNKIKDGAPRYFVPEGACGFAWVVVRPGNSSFARWAKKFKDARPEYGGGTCVKWVREFNQSVERKEAYAHAFAKVLSEAGINASARSRLD